MNMNPVLLKSSRRGLKRHWLIRTMQSRFSRCARVNPKMSRLCFEAENIPSQLLKIKQSGESWDALLRTNSMTQQRDIDPFRGFFYDYDETPKMPFL